MSKKSTGETMMTAKRQESQGPPIGEKTDPQVEYDQEVDRYRQALVKKRGVWVNTLNNEEVMALWGSLSPACQKDYLSG